MITLEANHKENGIIIAKMNALVDVDVIKALYEAIATISDLINAISKEIESINDQ